MRVTPEVGKAVRLPSDSRDLGLALSNMAVK